MYNNINNTTPDVRANMFMILDLHFKPLRTVGILRSTLERKNGLPRLILRKTDSHAGP